MITSALWNGYTAWKDALLGIFADPGAFLPAIPFLFAFSALIVPLFGPGRLSVDILIHRKLAK